MRSTCKNLLKLATFLLLCTLAQSVASLGPLFFKVVSGDNDNWFLRDALTSAQLLLTGPKSTNPVRRLVIAFPAGNSGALLHFLPTTTRNINGRTGPSPSSNLKVEMSEGSFKTVATAHSNVGVEAVLTFDQNATLGVTILGSVRAIRDYVTGGGIMHDVFNYTLVDYSERSLRLHRQWINTTSSTSSSHRGMDLYLTVPANSEARLCVTPGNNGTGILPTVDILVPPDTQDGRIKVTVVTNETSIAGLDIKDLFLPHTAELEGHQGLQTVLTGLGSEMRTAAQQLSFLAYTDKFAAGGWRFLTYFGRDSLIALRLLMPILSPKAIETILGSVIERTDVTGALCHEETIGDYASFINIQNGRPDLGGQPVYDYKVMIDTDHLLLPVISHYFLELPQGRGRAAAFFAQSATLQAGTYAAILNRTVHYNLERATPFAHSPIYSNLIGFRRGESTGNWRGSYGALGFGHYPFDVNAALVPASLRATQALVEAGILDFTRADVVEVGRVASMWEIHAPTLFTVTVDGIEAEQRLQHFVHAANLSDALIISTGTVDPSTANVSFYALSLKEDGTPVETLHSDVGFNLLYGAHVSREYLQHVVDALRPYPRGLLTNVGMVVANPAYDSNATNIGVLDRAAYHGTVVWSFQQGLMASGLARQLGYCVEDTATTVDTNVPPSPIPQWCSDIAFVQSLRDAQTRLWTAIEGAKDEIYSEVWSYSFDNSTNAFRVADLASLRESISTAGEESDAIQLWSYGFLALIDPRSPEDDDIALVEQWFDVPV